MWLIPIYFIMTSSSYSQWGILFLQSVGECLLQQILDCIESCLEWTWVCSNAATHCRQSIRSQHAALQHHCSNHHNDWQTLEIWNEIILLSSPATPHHNRISSLRYTLQTIFSNWQLSPKQRSCLQSILKCNYLNIGLTLLQCRLVGWERIIVKCKNLHHHQLLIGCCKTRR